MFNRLSSFNRLSFNRVVSIEPESIEAPIVVWITTSTIIICRGGRTAAVNIPRGDSRTLYYYIWDQNDQPVSLHDADVFYTVKKETTDLNSAIVIDKHTIGGGVEVIDPALALIAVYLSTDDTNIAECTYKFDIRVLKNGTEIYSTKPADFDIGDAVRKLPLI